LCIINIYIKLKNKKKMKKVIAIFAIATTMVACGGKGTTTEATTDSTAVVVDSTAVTATDSTTAEIPAETPATEAAVEKTK
jgi:ABC-type glycerol-3-phosphate transport system substrate-binding protein